MYDRQEMPESLATWLQEIATQFGDQPTLAESGDNSTVSCREIESLTATLAAGFKSLGLQRGQSIAIWLSNSPQWIIVHFAAARAGLLTIPINTWCRDSEVSHLLRLGQCQAIVLDTTFRGIDFQSILTATIANMDSVADNPLKWIINTGNERISELPTPQPKQTTLSKIQELGKAASIDFAPENQNMIAFATSGTTSLPKLALHGEQALLSHAKAIVKKAGMTPSDVVLAALPPCGAYGYGLILASLASGAKAIQCKEFDLDHVMNLIIGQGVTVMALTEPLVRKLLDHPQASRKAFQSLRIVFSAGGTLKPVVERAEQEFDFHITNVYGSSEILALAAFWPATSDTSTRSAAGGHLVSDGMQVRAVDSEDKAVPAHTPGELQFRGPVLTKGYLSNPDATNSAFTGDGWYRSQDLGTVTNDSGTSFHYTARLNDAIRLKGFLVKPGEIEDMLQSHPMVSAAQVVGVPDRSGEDMAAAFVILKQDGTIDSQGLRTFCRDHMASYKVPRLLEIVHSFPMTKSANGDKVVKHKLRDIAKDLLSND